MVKDALQQEEMGVMTAPLSGSGGMMFPCNVVVQEREDSKVEVAAVDPLAMFVMIPRAKEIALYASAMMQRLINHI